MSIPPAADLSTALGGPPARRGAVGLRRCHDCDLLVEVGEVPPGSRARCGRCGALLFAHKKDPARRALALYAAALALWVVSNAFPFMTLKLEGQEQPSRLLSGALSLYNDGLWQLALLVLLFVIVFPLGKILMNLAVLLAVHQGRRPRWMKQALPLGGDAAPVGDDRGLPAGRAGRVRQAAGPGEHRHRPVDDRVRRR